MCKGLETELLMGVPAPAFRSLLGCQTLERRDSALGNAGPPPPPPSMASRLTSIVFHETCQLQAEIGHAARPATEEGGPPVPAAPARRCSLCSRGSSRGKMAPLCPVGTPEPQNPGA